MVRPAESAALAKLGPQCACAVPLVGQVRGAAPTVLVSVARVVKMSSIAARTSLSVGCCVASMRSRSKRRATTSRAVVDRGGWVVRVGAGVDLLRDLVGHGQAREVIGARQSESRPTTGLGCSPGPLLRALRPGQPRSARANRSTRDSVALAMLRRGYDKDDIDGSPVFVSFSRFSPVQLRRAAIGDARRQRPRVGPSRCESCPRPRSYDGPSTCRSCAARASGVRASYATRRCTSTGTTRSRTSCAASAGGSASSCRR
jgi:hypothetical protein